MPIIPLLSRGCFHIRHKPFPSYTPISKLAQRLSSTMASDDQKYHGWSQSTQNGEYVRGMSQFRDWISREEGAIFPPEKGRYHLYISYACPWAHRTLITRKLKGLEDVIPVTSVHWHMSADGWRFTTPSDKLEPRDVCTSDPHHPTFTHLRDLYIAVEPSYNGRFTVPILYDTQGQTIVNNESSEIIRMLNSEFNEFITDPAKRELDLYPEELRSDIDQNNSTIYDAVNNGLYKCGFATTQEAYERALTPLFTTLDAIEARFADRRKETNSNGIFYFGPRLTETDIRLFTTIVRFDVVYAQHFKTNIRDIRSGYPHIHDWLRALYWTIEPFQETTVFEHIKKHYTKSHKQINPHSITPVGPLPDILPMDKEVNAVQPECKS